MSTVLRYERNDQCRSLVVVVLVVAVNMFVMMEVDDYLLSLLAFFFSFCFLQGHVNTTDMNYFFGSTTG